MAYGDTDQLYLFGEFILGPGEKLSTQDGAPIDASRNALRLLELLISRAPQTVPYADIEAAIWSKRNVDVTTSTHTAVKQLRKALRDDPAAPRFIQTAPREGYRFLANIETRLRTDEKAHSSSQRRWRGSANVIVSAVTVAGFAVAASLVAMVGAAGLMTSGKSAISISVSGQRESSTDAQDMRPSIRQRLRAGETLDDIRLSLTEIVALDPESSGARADLAEFLLMYDYQFEQARTQVERALELDPRNADAHRLHAYMYAQAGRLDAAVSRMALAADLAPASHRLRAEYGVFLGRARRFEESRDQCAIARAANPAEYLSQICLFYANWRLGAFEEAKQAGLALTRRRPYSDQAAARLVAADNASFYTAFWRETLAHYERTAEGPTPPSLADLALAHAGAGEHEAAIRYLRAARAEHVSRPAFILLPIDPHVDQLRSHPDFLALQAEIRQKMALRFTAQAVR